MCMFVSVFVYLCVPICLCTCLCVGLYMCVCVCVWQEALFQKGPCGTEGLSWVTLSRVLIVLTVILNCPSSGHAVIESNVCPTLDRLRVRLSDPSSLWVCDTEFSVEKGGFSNPGTFSPGGLWGLEREDWRLAAYSLRRWRTHWKGRSSVCKEGSRWEAKGTHVHWKPISVRSRGNPFISSSHWSKEGQVWKQKSLKVGMAVYACGPNYLELRQDCLWPWTGDQPRHCSEDGWMDRWMDGSVTHHASFFFQFRCLPRVDTKRIDTGELRCSLKGRLSEAGECRMCG